MKKLNVEMYLNLAKDVASILGKNIRVGVYDHRPAVLVGFEDGNEVFDSFIPTDDEYLKNAKFSVYSSRELTTEEKTLEREIFNIFGSHLDERVRKLRFGLESKVSPHDIKHTALLSSHEINGKNYTLYQKMPRKNSK